MEILLTLLVLLGVIYPSVATEISVFALERGSAIFEKVQKNLIAEFDEISCKMNSSYNIMRFFHLHNHLMVDDGFKDRFFFNTTTFSLEMRNLLKNDSGLYTFIIRRNATRTTLTYKLFVLEPVAAPVLTVVSDWSSSNSCNMTVTCRGHDVSLTFSCNSSDCTQLGDLPNTPTLAVYIRDRYIVCNHSNHVSWHNVSLDMSSQCEFKQEEDSKGWILLIVGLMSAGTVAAFTVMCIYLNRKLRSTGRGLHYYASIRFSRRPAVTERTAACSSEQDERAKAMNNLMRQPQSEPVIYSLLQPPRPEDS